MSIATEEELRGLRRVGRVVALALREMASQLRPGITTEALDSAGAAVLARHGAQSAPQLCVGFPGATCISVNDEAAHGIPGNRVVRDGDLVNLDVSAELAGFFADAGASYPVGRVDAKARRLCTATRRALTEALAVMRPGRRLGATGLAVERVARRDGLHAIRNLCAHGVGRWLHEEPLEISNVAAPGDHRCFRDGMVVAMETFLSTGSSWVVPAQDGWTLQTGDGSLAAQFEHTVVVTRDGPLVVTVV